MEVYTELPLSVDRLNLASRSGLREAVEIQMSPCSRVRVVIKPLPLGAADLGAYFVPGSTSVGFTPNRA